MFIQTPSKSTSNAIVVVAVPLSLESRGFDRLTGIFAALGEHVIEAQIVFAQPRR